MPVFFVSGRNFYSSPAQILGLPELMVEDGHEIFLLGTGTYVDKRSNATLTATRLVAVQWTLVLAFQ